MNQDVAGVVAAREAVVEFERRVRGSNRDRRVGDDRWGPRAGRDENSEMANRFLPSLLTSRYASLPLSFRLFARSRGYIPRKAPTFSMHANQQFVTNIARGREERAQKRVAIICIDGLASTYICRFG